MEAKKNSQRAAKSMINSNTILLHIGNFETGKRTNLKRAVSDGIGNWCNYLPIYEINGIEYVPMSQPYIIGRYE